MPSTLALPTISEIVSAASDAVTGEADEYGDVRSGSIYNHCAGPTAIIFSREADRDQDQFKNIYFDSAQGYGLTRYIEQRGGPTRILDTAGRGTCMFARATLGTSGSLLQGTRIQVAGNPPSVYEVAEDTLVGGVSATVPVQASVTGTGVAITSASSLVLLDPVYDNTWKPVSLTCADGTNFEKAADYRARFLQDKLTSRTGYLPNLVLACQNAGAVYVAAFPSSYGLGSASYANDFGLNAIYVADAGFSSNASLVSDCQAALEDWRVLGADLWVGGMTNIPLTMNFLVSLVDAPSSLPIAIIQRSAVQAILATFGTTQGGYIYSAHALQSAVNNSSKYIQTAAVPRAWAASTRYSIGDLVYAASCVQQCTESGESGLSVPSFSSVTGTVVYDGSASWKCTPHPSTGIFAAGVLQTTDPTLSSSQWPALLERYSVSSNNIRFNFTGPL